MKNVLALLVGVGAWLAVETGYLSPDRPTRPQWEAMEQARTRPAGTLVYRSNLTNETLSDRVGATPTWSFYNGATDSMVKHGTDGITVSYNEIAWVGAALHFPNFEPSTIYRVSIDAKVDGEPGAVIIRNRQLDLMRETIPVGSGVTKVHFASPPGRLDRVLMAFIPDGRDKPKGTMQIKSVTIERMGK